jgi:hypothetical protein
LVITSLFQPFTDQGVDTISNEVRVVLITFLMIKNSDLYKTPWSLGAKNS